MLVQYTPIAALPPDVATRLRQHLVALPILQSSEPIYFNGYHIRADEALQLQRLAKVGATQPLFG